MTFYRITQKHPYLKLIQLWYEHSFPSDERRNFAQVIALLPQPDMHLCALVIADQPVGFVIYWQWESVLFIEHFAIDPEQRGKQFGQQALTSLINAKSEYLVLEVERPVNEDSHRRIKFYERQGFTLNPFDYNQPPYQAGKSSVPMRLMSIPAISNEATFIELSDLIKERVYERFYTQK